VFTPLNEQLFVASGLCFESATLDEQLFIVYILHLLLSLYFTAYLILVSTINKTRTLFVADDFGVRGEGASRYNRKEELEEYRKKK
jgi:hypothetical protein